MGSVSADSERQGTAKHLPGGKSPGIRDVIREGVESKTRNVVRGRIQKTLQHPLQGRPLPLSKPPLPPLPPSTASALRAVGSKP